MHEQIPQVSMETMLVGGNYFMKVNVRHRQQVFFSAKNYLHVQSSYDIKQIWKRVQNFDESILGGVILVWNKHSHVPTPKASETIIFLKNMWFNDTKLHENVVTNIF